MKVKDFLISLAIISFSKMAVRHKVDIKIMDREVTSTQIHEFG